MRTRETIIPRTRSIVRDVLTEFKFDGFQGESLYIPLSILRKGVLQDRSEITRDGMHCRVLTYLESTAIFLAVVRVCLEAAEHPVNPIESATDRYSSTYEDYAIRLVTSYPPPSSERTAYEAWLLAGREWLAKMTSDLKNYADSPEMVSWAGAILESLLTHYVIVVHTSSTNESTLGIKARDIAVPQAIRLKEAAATSGGPLSWANRVSRLLNGIHSMLGARPARFTVDAQLARHCQSYHLEIEGPEGTFLSFQELVSHTRKEFREKGAYDRWRKRCGQRYGHFYARSGWKLNKDPRVRFSFMERPPGSIAPATLGAVAASFLYGVALLVDLKEEDARVAYAALFLAFPAGFGAWIGLSEASQGFGTLLTTRFVNVLTIALGLAGAVLMMKPDRDTNEYLLAASLCVSLLGAYWWMSRSFIYARFAGEQ
jgi:hypothetical protein